jgi:hypothetical protein
VYQQQQQQEQQDAENPFLDPPFSRIKILFPGIPDRFPGKSGMKKLLGSREIGNGKSREWNTTCDHTFSGQFAGGGQPGQELPGSEPVNGDDPRSIDYDELTTESSSLFSNFLGGFGPEDECEVGCK